MKRKIWAQKKSNLFSDNVRLVNLAERQKWCKMSEKDAKADWGSANRNLLIYDTWWANRDNMQNIKRGESHACQKTITG